MTRADVPVTEYDEIATMGAAEYPTEPGTRQTIQKHVFNQSN